MKREIANETDCACGRRYFTEAEAADRLGLSKKWLQSDRQRGAVLPYFKFRGAIRYLGSDIEKFERESARLSTSDAGQKPVRLWIGVEKGPR